ncbi:MAG: hypothetical protein V9G98_19260 [Candidatus Competibacter sp.]
MQRDCNFVLAQHEPITVVEPDRLVLGDALFGIVEENPVLASIGEEIGAIPILHGAVQLRQDAFRILQHPIVLWGTAKIDRPTVENLGGFLVGREPLIAGDGQFQRHGARSVGRGLAITARAEFVK